jgi:hypothetical protein
VITAYPPMLGVLPANDQLYTQIISPLFQEKVLPFAIVFAGG